MGVDGLARGYSTAYLAERFRRCARSADPYRRLGALARRIFRDMHRPACRSPPPRPVRAPRSGPGGRNGVLGPAASAPPASAVGEVCFNTAMTGYQEILTDPSYAGADHQLHLSAYRQCRRQSRGYRDHDPAARGLVCAATSPTGRTGAPRSRSMRGSNRMALIGIAGVDTRRLTRRIRDRRRAQRRDRATHPTAAARYRTLQARAASWPGLEGHGPGQRSHLPPDLSLGRDARGRGQGGYGRPSANRAIMSSPSITAPSATSCGCWQSTVAGLRWCRPPPRPRTSCATGPTASFCRTGRAIRPRPAAMRCRCCAN